MLEKSSDSLCLGVGLAQQLTFDNKLPCFVLFLICGSGRWSATHSHRERKISLSAKSLLSFLDRDLP
eukprot:457945-Amphidinium_carterae.1